NKSMAMNKGWDVVIVLGCAPKKNNFPSYSLTQRVKKAKEIYNKGLTKKVIFSGGPNKTEVPESLIMQETSGIPRKDTIIEKEALKTTENAFYTGLIVKKENFKSCLVVTSPFHIARSVYIFKKIFPRGVRLKFAKSDEKICPLRWLYLLLREARFFMRDYFDVPRLAKTLRN
ncbi:MAG: YdcF family protein, partial [bacterium]|nr:YdcF family protein [bacterium]